MRTNNAPVQRSLIRSSFLTTSLSSAAALVVTSVSGILLARILGPEARGEYGMILMIGQTVAAIGTFSFFEGAIVVIRQKDHEARDLLPTIALGALLLTFATAATMLLFFLVNPGLQTVGLTEFYLLAVLIVIANSISNTFSTVERAQMAFNLVNLSRLLAPTIFSALLLCLWLFGYDRSSTLLVLILFLLAKLPFLIFWITKYIRSLIGPVNYLTARDVWTTGMRLHFAAVLALLSGQIDRLFGIGIWPSDVLGQYFVAFSVVGAGYSVVTTAIRTVIFPYFSGLSGTDRVTKLARLLRLTVLSSLAIFLLGAIIVPVAVPLVYGQAFAPASDYAFMLLFSMAVVPLQVSVLETHRSRGRGMATTIMSLAPIAAMLTGFWITGYGEPEELIIAFGAANGLSAFVGILLLVRAGELHSLRALVPGMEDLELAIDLLLRRR